MSLNNFMKNIIIVICSMTFSFLVVEMGYRFLKYDNKKKNFNHRTMLFTAGPNFQNFNDFLKYEPNTKIRSTTLYSVLKPKDLTELIIEYDYEISTNNAGLVMHNNLNEGENVIYVIGDSFTEGQGAHPWFYALEESKILANLKVVNLGILGTGPQQWKSLKNFITNKFSLKIDGTVINIIPADMNRDPWLLTETELKCLNYAQCPYSFQFQGFNFTESMNNKEIKQKVLNHINNTDKPKSDFSFKEIIKKSSVITDLFRFLRQSFTKSDVVKRNEQALLDLKIATEGNLHVNVVSIKKLNSMNYKKYPMANNLINFLENNDFKFSWCDIPNKGFRIYDDHPNEVGYEYLRACTENAIKSLHLPENKS